MGAPAVIARRTDSASCAAVGMKQKDDVIMTEVHVDEDEKVESPMDSPMNVDIDLQPGDTYRSDLMTVRPVPSAGLGLFATAPIPAGTLLICESPLIVLHENADLPDLYAQLTSLPPHRQAAYTSLSHYARRHTSPDYIPTLRARYTGPSSNFEAHCTAVLVAWMVYETNRFTVRSAGGARDHMGVFPLAARLNHSCRPNVFHRHNHLLERLTIYALKDIDVGEEVCTSYIDIVHPTPERRRLLRHWGFKCTCVLCKAPREGGELRRKKLEEMTFRMRKVDGQRTEREWSQWDYAKALGRLEEMVTLMREEGLDESDSVGEVLGLGAEYAMGVGWWDMARQWADRALGLEERCLGRENVEWQAARTRLTEAEKGTQGGEVP